MLKELGHDSSALGVARMYSSIASTLIIDNVDVNLKPEIEALGMRCVVTDTIMADTQVSAELARTTLASLKGK
jgi:LPPG:FO 2-phospho-L-lactate transferase